PIDPRSMFRGNYARLRYDISQIPARDVNRLLSPRHGEVVYVKLAPEKNSTWGYNGVSLKKPSTPPFLKGRIQSKSHRASGNYRVRYGIEAFFAPKAKALALEKTLRHSAVAKIYVTKNGKAALKEVIDGSDG
ncbi:MAG: GDYXXLXY domain-containing protein, partial [bacterium]|nr:GDYXXLXY domain-containing protein [bacterium]